MPFWNPGRQTPHDPEREQKHFYSAVSIALLNFSIVLFIYYCGIHQYFELIFLDFQFTF